MENFKIKCNNCNSRVIKPKIIKYSKNEYDSYNRLDGNSTKIKIICYKCEIEEYI